MAEGGDAGRESFYCHHCSEEIEPCRTDEELTCPKCKGGFVERVERTPDPSALSHGDGGEHVAADPGVSSQGAFPFAPLGQVFMSRAGVRHHHYQLRSQPAQQQAQQQAQQWQRPPGNLEHNYHDDAAAGEGTHVFSAPRAPLEFPAGLDHLFSHLPVTMHTQPNGQQVFMHGQHQGFGSDGPVHPMANLMQMMFQRDAQVPSGRMGDYVFGQGGLDAVITQLLESMDGPQPVPVSQNTIDRLPKVSITAEQCAEKVACSVCWDDFELGSRPVQLPCNHMFHQDCIEPWIRQHNTCPVCRKVVEELDGSATSTSTGSTMFGSSAAPTATSTSSSSRTATIASRSREPATASERARSPRQSTEDVSSAAADSRENRNSAGQDQNRSSGHSAFSQSDTAAGSNSGGSGGAAELAEHPPSEPHDS